MEDTVTKRMPNRTMPDDERAKNIALLKDLVRRLEEGKEETVQFALTAVMDEQPDVFIGTLWGSMMNLAQMLSNLSAPIVQTLVGKGMLSGGHPSGVHPEDRDKTRLLN